MTSALGNYIHRSVSGYKQWGSGTKDTGYQSPFISYNKQKKINQQRLEALKNDSLTNQLKDLSKQINSKLKDIKNIDNSTDEAFETFNTDMIKFLSSIGAGKQKDLASKYTLGNKTMKDLRQLEKLREEIYTSINLINQGENKSLKTLKAKINAFNTLYSQITNKKSEISLNEKLNLKQIQEAANHLSIASATTTLLKGNFGEYLVGLFDDEIKGQVSKSVYDALTKGAKVIGSSGSKFQVTDSQIKKEVGQYIKKEQVTQEDKFNIYTAHSSYNKIDVSILFGKVPIKASVKTYSSIDNTIRTSLQQVNLLYSLLSTELQFGNHWINLYSLYNDGSKVFRYQQEYSIELEKHIAYEALVSGNLLKKNGDNANSFIVIDTRTGTVYAKSTYDILTDFYTQQSSSSSSIVLTYSSEKDTINTKLKEINSGSYRDANKRIGALLNYIYNQSIKVKIMVRLSPQNNNK